MKGITTLLSLTLFGVAASAIAAQGQAPIDATTYPRTVSTAGGTVLVHHPVIEDWHEFERLSGWTPVEVTAAGGQRWVGSLYFEVDTVIHLDERMVGLRNGRVLDVKYSGEPPADAVIELARNALKSGADTVVLDFIVRALPDDFHIPGAPESSPNLNFSPPRIVVSNRAMDLMLIDGPPSTTPIEPTALEYVVNTNWDIFHHTESGRWYILRDGIWLQNSMLAGGDWSTVDELPGDFFTLQGNDGWEFLDQTLPLRQPETTPLPLLISYEPTELVVVEGEAQMEEIGGTGISYVTNTDSDLFVLDSQTYLLVTGRWFRTKNIKRKWYAARPLPEAFSNIPPDHPKGHVLAAVPGTRQARVAMIEAAIPRVIEHDLGQSGQVGVVYAGEPNFVAVEGADLRRADNSPFQVFLHNNFYYLCHEGAWYASANPDGPWRYATEVPEAIYDIPPTDPAYNVTFVKVKSFDDSSNRVAYSQTNGYRRAYSTGSSVVYGSGWYYPGTIHHYPYGYPVYGHYPHTYGWGARYHPVYGRYGYRGAYWGYHPYPMSYSATYNTTIREKDWEWDLDGSKRQVYGHGSRNYVGSGTYKMNGASMEPPPANAASVGQSGLGRANNGDDDLYSGPNGEIYRKTGAGWQQMEGQNWVTVSGAGQEYLDRQFDARQTGYRNYEQRIADPG
jgi:hypothetical protein